MHTDTSASCPVAALARVNTCLGDILTPNVTGVPQNAPMSQALRAMRQEGISSVVAMHRGKPVGILTERGVVAAMAQHGQDLLRLPVRSVMSSPLITAPEDMPIPQAFSMLLEKGIRHLVVVGNKGRPRGMVTQTNMVRNLGVEYFVEVKRVGQIMSRSLASLQASDSLEMALTLMVAGPLSCAVALGEDRPLGIITERDMVGFLDRGLDFRATRLEEVMSRPVRTVVESLPVHLAASLMSEAGVRRLVVVDGEGRVSGLLTQSDIVKGMEARYVEMLKEVIREKDHLLRLAENDAARKSAYLDTILNTSIDMGIAATDHGRIAFVNSTAQGMLGVSEELAVGLDVLEFHRRMGISPRRMKQAMARVRREGSHRFQAMLNKDGRPRYLEGRVSALGQEQDGFVLMLRDVTERRQAEEAIKHMAYHDPLTGLPNRYLVQDRLEQGLAQAKRRGCLLAVMLLDLDGFKTVNDSLGHDAGDTLLRQVAASLSGYLRKSDTVGRMGGDEFLVVLPEVKTPEGAASVASKMLAAVRGITSLENAPIRVSVSIGLALYPWDGMEATALIQRADQAMYKAKDCGRDTYRFASLEDNGFVNLP